MYIFNLLAMLVAFMRAERQVINLHILQCKNFGIHSRENSSQSLLSSECTFLKRPVFLNSLYVESMLKIFSQIMHEVIYEVPYGQQKNVSYLQLGHCAYANFYWMSWVGSKTAPREL